MAGPITELLARPQDGAPLARTVSLLELDGTTQLPEAVLPDHEHFACLVVADASALARAPFTRFAERLLTQGAVFVMTWGTHCEHMHDLFDEIIIGEAPTVAPFKDILTTWHAEQSFDDTLWDLLHIAVPNDRYPASCTAALIVTVDDHASLARSRLADIANFCHKATTDPV